MAEVISHSTLLSDSNHKTRPNCINMMYTDANAGGNAVQQIVTKRRLRHMKFPDLTTRHDVDSFEDVSSAQFKKWSDEGDKRAPAPYRAHDIIADPVSGFVSAGGDAHRHTGHVKIKPMGHLPNKPQYVVPQFLHSKRKNNQAAPPETDRLAQSDPGRPSTWNGRSVSDQSIRANLGGWTSKTDGRLNAEGHIKNPLSQCFTPMSFREKGNQIRDSLAQKFMFTSSCQRSYQDVPWDAMLVKKGWPATQTLEDRPDMISQLYTLRRYHSQPQEWQLVGNSWDRHQRREGFFDHGPNVIAFCSPTLRNQHIPGYSGVTGADNLHDIDNKDVPMTPYTVKRNPQPWYSDTAHRPNIPGYQGCTLYTAIRRPSHSNQTPPELQTTARVHRSMNVEHTDSEHKRHSIMSKMITTVPPGNPFNVITKKDITVDTPDSN